MIFSLKLLKIKSKLGMHRSDTDTIQEKVLDQVSIPNIQADQIPVLAVNALIFHWVRFTLRKHIFDYDTKYCS